MANNSTFDFATSTMASTQASVKSMPAWIGYIALVIAAVFLGSNWVPIKKVKSGDGMLLNSYLSSYYEMFDIFNHFSQISK